MGLRAIFVASFVFFCLGLRNRFCLGKEGRNEGRQEGGKEAAANKLL